VVLQPLAASGSDCQSMSQDQEDHGFTIPPEGTDRGTERVGVLRGWSTYVARGNSGRKFSQIDRSMHKRLLLFNREKSGRHGRGWGAVHTWEWYKRPDAPTLWAVRYA
jgi:hypothetical protein